MTNEVCTISVTVEKTGTDLCFRDRDVAVEYAREHGFPMGYSGTPDDPTYIVSVPHGVPVPGDPDLEFSNHDPG